MEKGLGNLRFNSEVILRVTGIVLHFFLTLKKGAPAPFVPGIRFFCGKLVGERTKEAPNKISSVSSHERGVQLTLIVR